MKLDAFVMVTTAGFFATYAHMMVALWADKLGLARLDFARGMSHTSPLEKRSKEIPRTGWGSPPSF
ncbi:MAG: hypothetical protein QGH70_02375 [Nitrospinota bacterium]|nr:hypothetical protein [Nitrospinota bacterium]MDP6482676.1 hypothetical protein [Nitrospinota bacterium]HJM42275.1 hypothetical protein [Nitrospinota bacterium]